MNLKQVDVAFKPRINVWRAMSKLSLELVDIKSSLSMFFICCLLLASFFTPSNNLEAAEKINMLDIRSIALSNSSSAFATEGSSNDLNPAGAALMPIYRASAMMINSGSGFSNYQVTITDAKTSSLAGSLSFRQVLKPKKMDYYAVHFALAQFFIPKRLILGVNGTYINYDNKELKNTIKDYNASAGLIFIPYPGMFVSASTRNFIETGTRQLDENVVQAGFAHSVSPMIQYYLDYVYLEGGEVKEPHLVLAGSEFMFNDKFIVYAGYGGKELGDFGSVSGGFRFIFNRATAMYAFQQKGLYFDDNTHSFKFTYDF